MSAPTEETRGRLSGRVAWLVGLAVTVVVAAGVSYFASGHLDGLEFVADSQGFIDAGEDSATAGSPLSDYQTSGLAEGSWASGAVAGVIGCAVVLALMTGLALVLRRRRRG